MMDREEARELFSAYRDGDLSAEQLNALESFLDRDDECREEYERFCRAIDSLALLQKQPAPPHFVEKVQTRIRRRSGGKLFTSRGGSVSRVPYELFSLVLILILLSVYLLTLPMLRVGSPSPSGRGHEQEGQTQREER